MESLGLSAFEWLHDYSLTCDSPTLHQLRSWLGAKSLALVANKDYASPGIENMSPGNVYLLVCVLLFLVCRALLHGGGS